MQGLILQVRAGSHAYGLAGPHSDQDSRGVCIPPKAALLGLQSFEQWQDEKSDNVVFGLPKFVRLALEGNPNLIETLFTEDILHIDRFGQRLLEHRQLFLSRKVAERFGHYAIAQLKRLENHHRWWAHPPHHFAHQLLKGTMASVIDPLRVLGYLAAGQSFGQRGHALGEAQRPDTVANDHVARIIALGAQTIHFIAGQSGDDGHQRS